MTFHIPVVWSMTSVIDVEADSIEEAMEIAKDEEGKIALPDKSDYLDGSWGLAYESEDENLEFSSMVDRARSEVGLVDDV